VSPLRLTGGPGKSSVHASSPARRRAGRARWVAGGVSATLLGRALLTRAMLIKLRRDVRALNSGDYGPILSNFAEDAVLQFNDGEHRWAGEHRGRQAIAAFLRDFVGARLQGEIIEIFFAGPPWRMTLLARFNDHAEDPAGREIYHNQTVLLARTRWGQIVRQEDYYEDTQRIEALEKHLTELE
jgi:ketosteroid isomerase-like protein